MRGMILAAGRTLVAAEGAVARPADCFLQIDGLTVVDGRCDFQGLAGDGGFQVTTPDGGYVVQVLINRRGEGDGWWNKERWSTQAQSALGPLYRDDACWSNRDATVCAW